MKKALYVLAAAAVLVTAERASATPSTVVWTPATTYTQPYLVPHLTYDTYFGEGGRLLDTYGLTVGVLPFEALQGEIGFDLFYPGFTTNNLQLNGKLTLVEGALGSWSPGLSVGIMGVGFESDISDYNLVHGSLGKTTPVGTLSVGGYYGAGSEALWTGTDGVKRSGFMASYASPELKVGLPGLEKVLFAADVMTGKNGFGAWGASIVAYFNSNVALLTGPVFFLDKDLYKAGYGTDFMWTAQLDVDIPFKK